MTSKFLPDTLEAEFSRIVRRQQQARSQAGFKRWLQDCGRNLLDFLTGQQSLNLQKRESSDGTCQWVACDPNANAHHTFDSEQALRVWLEQRHLS